MIPEDIKIINTLPPFIDDIIKAGMKPRQDTIYPYGNAIYNPSKLEIPQDVWIHEALHIAQQGENPADWWRQYIVDKQFRFRQELEANKEQYKFVCKVLKDKNQRARSLLAIARNMAGEVYDLNISINKLMELIK